MKVSILGSRINIVSSYEEAFMQLQQYLRGNNPPAYVTVNNVHTVVEGVLRSDYRSVTNQAFMAMPDGRPLSIVGNRKGHAEMQRVFGPTLFEKSLEWGQEDGLRHFLFGGSEQTLAILREKIASQFPACSGSWSSFSAFPSSNRR